MRKSQLSLIISSLALLFAVLAFCHSHLSDRHLVAEEQQFCKKFLNHVKACVEFNEDIKNKQEVLALLNSIENESRILETGSDDLRVKYVTSQGCIEHVLACAQVLGDVDHLIGVIHTPTVATPLCVLPDGPYDGVLDESIRYDLGKLLTVRSRANIVREYLAKGGKLYVVYPQGGREKRTAEQLKIYQDELNRYTENLIDWVLSCKQIDPDMIGATYLFRNNERNVFAFSIKSRQANDIQKQAEWGIWFGPVDDPAITERVNSIFDYLSQNAGPDPRQEV